MDDRRRAREASRAAEIDAANRGGRWRAPVYLIAWSLCFVAGTAVTLSSFWVSSQEMGDVLFWGGLCLGNVGGLLVVMVYAVRGTARGEL
jgi:hypothetical protein